MEKGLRERIVDASVALVAESGVHALSFREVARRAGVSHQAPYHHFGNRLGILQAIAADGFTSLTAAVTQAADAAGPDPGDALEAAGRAYIAFARTHRGHVRVMFDRAIVTAHEATEPPDATTDTYGVVRQLAQSAHDAGLAPGIPSETLAHLCWSTVHGLAVLVVDDVLPAKGGDADVVIDEVVRALSKLLRP
ncbi:MAG: TetR/AcrR family transcriptional regulator [Myxococcota bacterium]